MSREGTDALGDGEVDVWITRPRSLDEAATAVFEAMLSEEERERADAFSFAHHRRDYVVAHALLRIALARCVGEDPGALTFTASAGGRPALVGAPSALDFSLSHTEGLAAVAVSRAAVVGVDAENLERSADYLELADRYFDTSEARMLRALPEEPRRRRFVELWTLKEAYAKACGAGLSLPLDRVAFTLAPGRKPRATFARELAGERGGWQFAVLHPTPRHVLAVARNGPWPLRPRLLVASSPALRAAARAHP